MFIGHPVEAGRILQIRGCPFFYCSRCFLGIEFSVSSKFWHGAKKPYEVVGDSARFFRKSSFALKNSENGSKGSRSRGFLIYKKNVLFHFHWICFIMKIILSVLYLHISFAKTLFMRYWLKGSLAIRFQFFKWTISPEQFDEIAWFLAWWYKLPKIKIWLKIFFVAILKNRYGQSGHGTVFDCISRTKR